MKKTNNLFYYIFSAVFFGSCLVLIYEVFFSDIGFYRFYFLFSFGFLCCLVYDYLFVD